MKHSQPGATNGKPRVLAFFPVFNQEDQVGSLLDRLGPVLEARAVEAVLAVDDGSTDRTPEILGQHPFCTVITHDRNRGIGDAIRAGYRHALEHGYDIFVILAGNAKDDPALIESLVEPIVNDGYDYVQGSRFLPGGQTEGLPAHRNLAMRVFTATFSLFLWHRLTDATNGFRAYRTRILRDPEIDWAQAWLGPGYQLEYYIHYKVISLGYRFKEVPVSKTYRRSVDGSYSKIRGRDWLVTLKPLFLLRSGLRR
jgi:dolichol-phosphate mannosyltransferase